jgi:hypothetical protein
MTLTVWEGGILEIRVLQMILDRRQFFWPVFILVTGLAGFD